MKKIYLILICALAAASCQREAELLEAYELGCPDASQYFRSPQAGSHTFEIVANGEYTAVINDSWLSFTDYPDARTLNGHGDGAISVSFPANLQETRVGTITMTRGTRVFDLVIKQRGELSSDAGVGAALVAASSSTLTFTWGMLDSDKKDYEHSYRFCLYRDEALTDMLVCHETDSTTSVWNKKAPVFTFGGLDDETTYWFVAHEVTLGTDELGQKTIIYNEVSDPVSGTTGSYEPVTIGEVPVAENAVIFAEDFSELVWNGDDINKGAGFRAKDYSRFVSPSGENPEGTLMNCSGENGLFELYGCGEAVKESRLKDWAKIYEPAALQSTKGTLICARTGYVKFGGQNYVGSLVTPKFTCIPEGMTAEVEVKFTASRYGTDSENIILKVVNGEVKCNELSVAGNGNTFECNFSKDSVQIDLKTVQEWNTYTCRLKNVKCDSRILIGPDYHKSGGGSGKSQHRMFLDDVKVTLIGMEEDIAPTGLKIEKVRFSDADIYWDGNPTVEFFKVYVNNELYKILEPDDVGVHLKNLELNTTYNVEVAAVKNGYEKKSEPVRFTTRNVWIVNKGRTNVCVQWDDISAGTAADGLDRGYVIEVLASDKETTVFGEICGGQYMQGVTSAFCSTDRLGRTEGVNHFPQMRVGIGLLEPRTDYYVRVKSVDNYTKEGLRLTNAAGTSDWSPLVGFTTDSPHIPHDNEVIWTGFDECGVLPDYKNMCGGIAPMIATGKQNAVFADDKSQYQWGFYPFHSVGHLLGTMGYNDLGNYVDGLPVHRDVNNYVMNKGSLDGWHSNSEPKPGIGVLLMNGTYNKLYLATPALSENLPSDGTEVRCKVTVTCGYYPYGVAAVKNEAHFVPYKWNGEAHVDVDTPAKKYTMPRPATYVDDNNYKTEITTVTHEFYVNLKKGDNLKFHVSHSNVFFDEILVETAE